MAEDYHVQKIERIIRMRIPRQPIPDNIEITETPFDEQQAMLREIDEQRRKEDPTFLGAFHEKKFKNTPTGKGKTKGAAKRSTGPKTGSSASAGRPAGTRPRTGAPAGSRTGAPKRTGGRGGRR